MLNATFYLSTVLIWGSTWLAIKYQLGSVAPIWSIAYRFALASFILLIWCLVTRRPMRFSMKEHLYMALQGILLFAVNYYFFYLAEIRITSGLAAVVFSTIVVMNLVNGRIFLGTPMDARVLVGGILGLFGLSLLFWPEMAAVNFSGPILSGLLLSFAATYLASLGNILSARNQSNHLPVLQTNTFGMAYGTCCMVLLGSLTGTPVSIAGTAPYLLSLVYLAFFGSVIAFGCYLTLIGRIGAGRAAYATLLFPIVALLLSTIWENYHWTLFGMFGMGLILFGNYLALVRKRG